MNAANLAPLVEQYIWRTDINLTRDISEKNTVQAPVLNLVGIHAAAAIIDETVTFNGRLTPTKANWIKIQVDSRSKKKRFVQDEIFCIIVRLYHSTTTFVVIGTTAISLSRCPTAWQ